jgi:hypothetical protein
MTRLSRCLASVLGAAVLAATLGMGVARADDHDRDRHHDRHRHGYGYVAPPAYYAPPPVVYAPPPPSPGINLVIPLHFR